MAPAIATVHFRQGAPQTVRVLRHEDQVDVIGHQAPGPYGDVGGPALAGEQVAIEGIIVGGKECLLPAVAALGDMVRDMGQNGSGGPGHGRKLTCRSKQVN